MYTKYINGNIKQPTNYYNDSIKKMHSEIITNIIDLCVHPHSRGIGGKASPDSRCWIYPVRSHVK